MKSRRFTSLDDPDFDRLFTGIRESWRRLETFQVYDVSYEREEFARFQRGEDPGFVLSPWEDMISAHVADGRVLQRVHVIEMPPTDYIRYELAYYEVSSAAGEDVRVIPVERGTWPAGVARHDYWIFDSREAWRVAYGETGQFLYAERDLDLPAATRSWDAAWRQAIPLNEAAASLAA